MYSTQRRWLRIFRRLFASYFLQPKLVQDKPSLEKVRHKHTQNDEQNFFASGQSGESQVLQLLAIRKISSSNRDFKNQRFERCFEFWFPTLDKITLPNLRSIRLLASFRFKRPKKATKWETHSKEDKHLQELHTEHIVKLIIEDDGV